VHPIERLRYVARAGDVDPTLLAEEAADALGSLAWDTRALVPAARRLIESHPTCAPLWWVCARVLVADDGRLAAEKSSQLLADDPTHEVLAAAFPAGATVVAEAGPTAVMALASRPDLTVRLVGRRGALRWAVRAIDRDVAAFDGTEVAQACLGADVVLVEPLAGGTSGVLLDATSAALSYAAGSASIDLWAVLGEGRTLPEALFGALLRHLGVAGSSGDDLHTTVRACAERWDLAAAEFDDSTETGGVGRSEGLLVLPPGTIRSVVGPTGVARSGIGLRRSTCPAPTELLLPSLGVARS
jgi:hypothetical protein